MNSVMTSTLSQVGFEAALIYLIERRFSHVKVFPVGKRVSHRIIGSAIPVCPTACVLGSIRRLYW